MFFVVDKMWKLKFLVECMSRIITLLNSISFHNNSSNIPNGKSNISQRRSYTYFIELEFTMMICGVAFFFHL